MQIIQYKSAKNLSFCGKSTMSMFIRFSFECLSFLSMSMITPARC